MLYELSRWMVVGLESLCSLASKGKRYQQVALINGILKQTVEHLRFTQTLRRQRDMHDPVLQKLLKIEWSLWEMSWFICHPNASFAAKARDEKVSVLIEKESAFNYSCNKKMLRLIFFTSPKEGTVTSPPRGNPGTKIRDFPPAPNNKWAAECVWGDLSKVQWGGGANTSPSFIF